MPQIPNLNDLIRTNPKVDTSFLAELDQLGKKLRELGTTPGQSKLASPVVRKRLIIGERDQSDPRTIRLGTRR